MPIQQQNDRLIFRISTAERPLIHRYLTVHPTNSKKTREDAYFRQKYIGKTYEYNTNRIYKKAKWNNAHKKNA